MTPRFSRSALLLLAGVVLSAAALIWLRPRLSPAEPAKAPEVARAALELRDGVLYEKGATAPFSGWLTESYPDGLPLSRSQLSEGRLHGTSEGWYTNGQIQIREQFVGGVSDGVRVKWHLNGATQSQAVIVKGELDGAFRRYHENGALAEEVVMKQGKPVGTSRAFYPSGCIKAQVTLQDGKVIEQRFWKDGEVPAEDVAGIVATAVERGPGS